MPILWKQSRSVGRYVRWLASILHQQEIMRCNDCLCNRTRCNQRVEQKDKMRKLNREQKRRIINANDKNAVVTILVRNRGIFEWGIKHKWSMKRN